MAKKNNASTAVKQTTSHTLKEMPADVYNILLREQNRIKEKKGRSVYSLESTVYNIIRNFERCKQQGLKITEDE